jgi:hypothetical protein
VDLMSQGVEASVPEVVRQTVEVVIKLNKNTNNPVTGAQVGRELKIDKSATDRRLKMAEAAGHIRNLEYRKGRPGRWVPGEPMPEDEEILPRPERLVDGSTIPGFQEGTDAPPLPSEDSPHATHRYEQMGKDRMHGLSRCTGKEDCLCDECLPM